MTSIPKDPRVSELRELFRNLEAFRTVYEATGVQEVTSREGNTWSLWDLDYLHRQAMEVLTPRQSQAISLYLVRNIRERDAAKMMGVSETNPIAMYASLGLRRLLDLVEAGALERFRDEGVELREDYDRRLYLTRLASFIKQRVQVQTGHCWAYPVLPGKRPTVLVRTRTGTTSLDAAEVLYEVSVEPVWPGFAPAHDNDRYRPEFASACINPRHQVLQLTEAERRRLRLATIRRAAEVRTRSDSVRALGVMA